MTDDVFHKVGTTLKTHFNVIDKGSPVTGLVQGDFDINVAKNGAGNQASTGVTITEVDAVNNPGEYYYEVNGATGYVLATGSYIVTLTVTPSTEALYYVDKRIVTSDGTGSGTIGAAYFESSTGDGRVTDGSSPIEDATVFFKNSAGDLITSLQTDSSGNYSLYLDETVTIYAQKAGYSQATGAITVVGSTATGPGADLELMSTAGNGTITYGELLSYARRVSGDHTGSHSDTILGEVVNDALMVVSNDGEWEHLIRSTTISVNAQYSTGSISVSTGSATVTLSGGTWPSWAASGEMSISGILYNVLSRDSDTELTLGEEFGQESVTDGEYILFQDSYQLPSDLIRFKSMHQGAGWIWGEVPVSYDELFRYKSRWKTASSQVTIFAIAYDKIHVYPYPSAAGDFNITYQKRIGEYSSESETIDFSYIHKQVLHRAIDMQIAMRFGSTIGNLDLKATEMAYKRALTAAVDADKSIDKYPPPDARARYSLLRTKTGGFNT